MNVLLLAALASAVPQQSFETAGRPVRVVLYDLLSTELSPEHLSMVSANLMAEVRKLKRVAAFGMDEVRALLSEQEQRQMEDCTDDSCMTAIAGALGADVVLLGSVGKVGAHSVMSIKRMDMKTAQVVHSFDRRMAGGTGEELLEAIGPAIEKLFPEMELRPGFTRGVNAEILARVNPPPIAPWVTIAVGGGGGVLALTAGAFFVRQQLAAAEYRSKLADSTEQAVSGRSLVEPHDRAESSHRVVVWTAPVGVTLLATAAVMFFFTDWSGAPVAPSVEVGAGAAAVGLTGWF